MMPSSQTTTWRSNRESLPPPSRGSPRNRATTAVRPRGIFRLSRQRRGCRCSVRRWTGTAWICAEYRKALCELEEGSSWLSPAPKPVPPPITRSQKQQPNDGDDDGDDDGDGGGSNGDDVEAEVAGGKGSRFMAEVSGDWSPMPGKRLPLPFPIPVSNLQINESGRSELERAILLRKSSQPHPPPYSDQLPTDTLWGALHLGVTETSQRQPPDDDSDGGEGGGKGGDADRGDDDEEVVRSLAIMSEPARWQLKSPLPSAKPTSPPPPSAIPTPPPPPLSSLPALPPPPPPPLSCLPALPPPFTRPRKSSNPSALPTSVPEGKPAPPEPPIFLPPWETESGSSLSLDDDGDGDGGSGGGNVKAEAAGGRGSPFREKVRGGWRSALRQRLSSLRRRMDGASSCRAQLSSDEKQMPPEMLTSPSEEPSVTAHDGVVTAMPGCAVTAVIANFSGDAFSFDASSGGTFHCKATDLIFEVGAAGRLRYGWREWPAELSQEQFIPISATFDINWDGCDGGLHALMIPHYLDLKRWKHKSALKVLHTRDGNIEVRDPQLVSRTHVRVLTWSLSKFTAVFRWIPGLVYHVHAAVLVFKVPGSLTKLQLHVVPYADANIERLKRKLRQERYEYYNIPPKSDETLVVAKRYALSCDVATNSIQPQKLTMENPASDNNFIHVSFDGAFEEVFLTLTKRGKQEKNVWTRTVQWRDKETAPQAPEAAKSRSVSPQSQEQLFDKIRSEIPALVGALQGDLTPLLNEFDAKKTLTPPEILKIRAVSSNNGGFEGASQLVTCILEKHAGISVPVWEALWQTRTTYQQLRGLLSDVFPDRDP